MKEGLFWETLNNQKVKCNLCRHRCVIPQGKVGICGVRKNAGGRLYSLNYGKIVAINIDPIEKKPLYHFLPGSQALSVACVGCNFRCEFCQNWDIAHIPILMGKVVGDEFPPDKVISTALRYRTPVIAYTYTEPTIFYEYALDIAEKTVEFNIKNVFVTNGYIEEKPLETISPFLHAANIDLKGWDKKFYATIVGARRDEVLKAIKHYKHLGIWIEITTLLIDGFNTKEDDIDNLTKFIVNELGEGTPWHISRFYPAYKMRDVPPTSIKTLKKAEEIGKKNGLKYVYIGNVYGMGEETRCPVCGKVLIRRRGFEVLENKLIKGRCPYCKTRIDGVFE